MRATHKIDGAKTGWENGHGRRNKASYTTWIGEWERVLVGKLRAKHLHLRYMTKRVNMDGWMRATLTTLDGRESGYRWLNDSSICNIDGRESGDGWLNESHRHNTTGRESVYGWQNGSNGHNMECGESGQRCLNTLPAVYMNGSWYDNRSHVHNTNGREKGYLLMADWEPLA